MCFWIAYSNVVDHLWRTPMVPMAGPTFAKPNANEKSTSRRRTLHRFCLFSARSSAAAPVAEITMKSAIPNRERWQITAGNFN
jgi:hypothetical protein